MNERKTPVRMPGYKFRVFLSVVLLVVGFAFQGVYSAIEGPLEGKLATGQLNGTTEDYVVGAWFATHNVTGMAWTGVFLLLACLWVPFVIRMGRYLHAVRDVGTVVLLLCCLGMSGCGPAPKVFYAVVGSEESLIVPKLEGDTESEKLDRLDYLKNAKIQAKRFAIPMEELYMDYGFGNYIHRAKVAVIRINCRQESCEWTKSTTTGTATKNQALLLKSLDGIFGSAGATLTAHITEGDEALYCTNYGMLSVEPTQAPADGQEAVVSCIQPVPDQVVYRMPEYVARPLKDVLEKDVRAFLQSCISEKFGSAPLEKTRTELVTFIADAKKETVAFFGALGITIDSVGSQEGVSYTNVEVQEILNERVRAVLDQKTALNELAQAEQKNSKNIAMAVAERDAANMFVESVEAMQFRQYLELQRLSAETFKERAAKWDKKMPQIILPSGGSSPVLLQLSTGQ